MNQAPQSMDSVGYLIVKVSTARGAIPLEDATVNIRGGEAEQSGVLYSLRTDRDGKTERVSLPAPSPALSQAPDRGTPYSTYHIDVFREGYVPLVFQQVPIFPAVVSIQPAVMVPQSDPMSPYGTPTPSTVYPEDPSTAL